MTKMTNSLETDIAEYFFSKYPQLYVALHTGDPTESGNLNEVTTTLYSAYSRKQLTKGTITNGITTNANDLIWSNMPATTITHATIWDSLSGGTCLFYSPLVEAQTSVAGDAFKILSGTLTIGFD